MLLAASGPLCHSTDFLAKELQREALFPEPQVGDFLLVLDCGSNTLSTFSKHCSRQTPPVFAFRKHSESGRVTVLEIKKEESELSALDFWN